MLAGAADEGRPKHGSKTIESRPSGGIAGCRAGCLSGELTYPCRRRDPLAASKSRPKKSTRPRTFQGLPNKATASLQSPLPLPAVPSAQSCKPPKGNI